MAGVRVTFASSNSQGDGHGVAFCQSSDTTKGLIVVHEWWGLNDQIQRQAKRLADEGGFKAIIPDVYRGKVAKNREEASHFKDDLDWKGAIADIKGAAKFLLSQGCKKVGVIGFCMGGALAFAAAALLPEVSAAAPFYGIPSADLADLTTVSIPVQAHFGKRDLVQGLSSPGDYYPLRMKLMDAGVNLEFHEYDAGHAFTNPNSPGYDEEAAELSLSRMINFMNKHL